MTIANQNPKPAFEAYCYQCCGGGKSLGKFPKKSQAERSATSHLNAYGHKTGIIPSTNS